MRLISEGITKVRAFEIPCGVWSGGESISAPRSVLVRWQSSWQDKFYQVYVNGSFAGVSEDTEQREMVIELVSSQDSSVRIEVFAVEKNEADIDFGSELKDSKGKSGRVRIGILREQNIVLGAMVNIYFNKGTGQIDFDEPINDEPIEVWANEEEKCGFGMSRFGFSDFGRDFSAAVGFGAGYFGLGQFGADADLIEWLSGELEAGIYKFAVNVIDREGNESEAIESGEIFVEPAAKGAEQLSVISFDEQDKNLVLGIN